MVNENPQPEPEFRRASELYDSGVPWCPSCQAFAPPVGGDCGACGTSVEWRDAEGGL